MIAKIGRGNDMDGLVRYLFGKGRGNEHSEQRVVASSEPELVPVGQELSAAELRTLIQRLDGPHKDFGVEVTGGHVWHLSLSNRADDRTLTDQQWADIAGQAMDRMGFTEHSAKAPCRWVAIGHGKSIAGNEHLHIAVSLVREDGTKASIWRDRVTMSKVCAEMEHTYGLHVICGRNTAGMPGVTRAEIERAAREGRAEPARMSLARSVRAAAVASESEAEFVRRLRRDGVVARPRFGEGGQDRVVGYSVAQRSSRDQGLIWFGGGRLGRDLTLPRLREYWEASPESTATAVAEWRGATPTTRAGREAAVGAAKGWQSAADAIDRTYEQLCAIPVSDTAMWAGTAREAAGVYAAWSLRIEGDRPGPLAHAADALARSAQGAPGGPMPTRKGARDFRGVAGVVTQALLRRDSKAGWMALLGQLNRTLVLVARVHAARAERLQADHLADLATGELAQMEDRFRRLPVAELAPGERVLSPTARYPGPRARPEEMASMLSSRPQAPERGIGR